MAFKLKFRNSLSLKNQAKENSDDVPNIDDDAFRNKPKLTSSELNKLTKSYPAWLKDNSYLKNLPGVYQGFLGQVQLQPKLDGEIKKASNLRQITSPRRNVDYINRFTDTERVYQLLIASRLPNEILAIIWAHVNKTFPGKLTNREVCLALALVAIFQRYETQEKLSLMLGNKNRLDLFSLVNQEKKPPIPKLFPRDPGSKVIDCPFPMSQSDVGLLIDLGENKSGPISPNILQKGRNLEVSESRSKTMMSDPLADLSDVTVDWFSIVAGHGMNLIDMDSDRLLDNFSKLLQIWLKFLHAARGIFKLSFDVLNVSHDRRSSLEALRCPQGQSFIKQLSLCYPIAHNIKFKIDELESITIDRLPGETQPKVIDQSIGLLHQNYLKMIHELMASINEYWAVLINLFHESGQTKFIEFIMDGLNYKEKTISSKGVNELAMELDSFDKPDVCSICHTKFYLIPRRGDTERDSGDLELREDEMMLLEDGELISDDKRYYYHARCANFWINNVDLGCLPFRFLSEGEILDPIKQ